MRVWLRTVCERVYQHACKTKRKYQNKIWDHPNRPCEKEFTRNPCQPQIELSALICPIDWIDESEHSENIILFEKFRNLIRASAWFTANAISTISHPFLFDACKMDNGHYNFIENTTGN